jgi:hypothetical protein
MYTRRSAIALMIEGSLLIAGCERKVAAERAPIAADAEKPLEPWETVDDAFKGCELG